jgi:hypothetical protein
MSKTTATTKMPTTLATTTTTPLIDAARATTSQRQAPILERDNATVRLVVTERNVNYRYAMRTLAKAMAAANNERATASLVNSALLPMYLDKMLGI